DACPRSGLRCPAVLAVVNERSRGASPPHHPRGVLATLLRPLAGAQAHGVRVGQTVNIEFFDDGGMFHTFTLVRGPSFNLQATAGESISGALTITKLGTYTFICSVPGHAQLGMSGT